MTIVTGAVLSVVVSVAIVNILAGYLGASYHGPPIVASVFSHGAAFGFIALTTAIVVGAITSSFRRGDGARTLLVTVFVSYFSLMVVFASAYFVGAFFGDYQDAVFKYAHYRSDGLRGIDGPFYLSRRAFYGIEPRFWSGVDWPVRAGKFPNGLPPGSYRLDPQEMRHIAATHSGREVIQFVPEAQLEIFADCLYFSVITMTTVGYGDVTPRSLPVRVGANLEAISNTVLLIFGMGVIFGSSNLRKTGSAGGPPQAPN